MLLAPASHNALRPVHAEPVSRRNDPSRPISILSSSLLSAVVSTRLSFRRPSLSDQAGVAYPSSAPGDDVSERRPSGGSLS